MASGATLNSRLRVLVARAFRAEKLYGSGTPPVSGSAGGRSERKLTIPQLAEMAGELRAKEWQKCYYQLRTALNDLLSSGSAQVVLDGVLALRQQFREKMEVAAEFVERATPELQDAAGRHEFSLLLKLTMELIRQKAIAQSCRAISDELAAVLKASGVNLQQERRRTKEPSWLQGAGEGEQKPAEALDDSVDDAVYAKGANVVQLRRHSAFGKGKR